MSKRLSEHRKEFFYRLRLALCLKRRNGGKRVIQGPTEVQCHALSYINSNVSVESDNICIKSTICGESVEQTPPAQLDPQYKQNTGGPDYLGQEKPRAGVVPNSAPCQIMHPLVLVGLGVGVGEGLGLGVGLGLGNQVAISTRGCIIWQGCRFRHNTGRGRPRKLFIDHFGGPDGRVKTTIKTDARRAHASKARRAITGQTPSKGQDVPIHTNNLVENMFTWYLFPDLMFHRQQNVSWCNYRPFKTYTAKSLV